MSDQPETSDQNTAGSGDGKDSEAQSETSTQERAQPPLVIQAQYVKDLSFEVPGAPGIFGELQKSKPDMQIRIDVQTQNLVENTHEVVLHIHAECKVTDQVAFILELSYGGVFTLNVAAEHVRPVLMIECPRLLFPYARQVISGTTLDGGFLPLMLAPVDFASLYQRQAQQQQAAQEPTSDTKLA